VIRNRSKPRIIIVDENKDVVSILAGTFGLKSYEVYKAYSAEECSNKVNELDGKEIRFKEGYSSII
jgi:DNA-binding NtrC family response regulator